MCAIMMMFATEAKSQIVKGEGFLGFNLSQIDGDKAFGYKHIGVHAGIGAIVPVYQKKNFNIDIALELALNQRGSHQGQIYNDSIDANNIITGEYDAHLTYLEVPLMVYFSDKQITSFGIGASYGRLIGLREYEHGKETNVNLTYTGDDKFSLDDWCILADLKFRIHERLKLGFRYQYSLAPIRTRDYDLINGQPDMAWQDVKQYNNVLTARLIYVFNEDRSKYIYDEYQFTGNNPKIHQKTIDKKLKKLRKQREREERKAEKNAK